MSDSGKGQRKLWTKKETLGLLKFYLARKDEFQHSRKRKFAYANVLNDMISEGVTDSSTTTKALEGKMRTLLMAYNNAKDNDQPIDESPFMAEMDAIFGKKSKSSTIPTPCTAGFQTLHRKTSREQYFERKLKLKREEMEKTLSQRAEFFAEMKEAFEEKWKAEDETERRKLALIEAFLSEIKNRHF